MMTFIERYLSVLRESHSVFGMLPGFYDGFLLDSEEQIPDPFTRSERTLALGMRVATNLFIKYWGSVAVESDWYLSRKTHWDYPVIRNISDAVLLSAVGVVINHTIGSAKTKEILQKDWNTADSNSPKRRNARMAKLWSLLVTASGFVFFAFTFTTERTQSCLCSWAKSFAKDALIFEPLTTLCMLTLSALFGVPVGGVSYKKRPMPLE
eukprot:TRINITY_DN20225_c0_g1_i1.p1 TRINITY_DN20225_c0_g1~~TRINITY_DN20225_c0_g1_i1.p1  ORF type:complete len:222 (+),score=43.54 TRINITY_DN20225_c0_g1_i1:42-668(+)